MGIRAPARAALRLNADDGELGGFRRRRKCVAPQLRIPGCPALPWCRPHFCRLIHELPTCPPTTRRAVPRARIRFQPRSSEEEKNRDSLRRGAIRLPDFFVRGRKAFRGVAKSSATTPDDPK